MDFVPPFFLLFQSFGHALKTLGLLCLGTLSFLKADEPPALAFNGGTATVANLPSGQWSYHRVEVPSTPGIIGWDVRVKNVTGTSSPVLVARRDMAPVSTAITASYPHVDTQSFSWPSGHQWVGTADWTGRFAEPGETAPFSSQKRLVMGMGSPLQPGTYYLGVYNQSEYNASGPLSFTLESQGIGTDQTIPVWTLGFTSGSNISIGNLPSREAAYAKVTVPANTPNWEFALSPSLGEMMMCVRRGTIPDCGSSIYSPDGHMADPNVFSEISIAKIGAERFVLLPSHDQDVIQAGDYYIAVIGEGQSPEDEKHVGTGTSSGVLASAGSVVSTQLGSVAATTLTQTVNLQGGQMKNFTFTIPEGATHCEVLLENRLANPVLHLVDGPRLAKPTSYSYYGFNSGQNSFSNSRYDDNVVSLINPIPGTYNVTVFASFAGYYTRNYPDASATLTISTAPPSEVSFDGGTFVMANQPEGSWRYFKVIVPAAPGLLGWDLRLKDVSGGGIAQLVACRDVLPENTSNWSYAHLANTWPSGMEWGSESEGAGRYRNADETVANYRHLVMGMGGPLEPGTYYVGVRCYNNDYDTFGPVSYTLESRGIGIGNGQAIPVTPLDFTAGSNLSINNLAPKEIAYVKVTIPANTPSWEVTLNPILGEMMMSVRRGTIPDLQAPAFVRYLDLNWAGYLPEMAMRKTGPERFVLLPSNNQDYLQAGDYYIAVISEGQNPADTGHYGTGNTSGVLTSLGPLVSTDLGDVSAAVITRSVNLLGGQLKNFTFNIPAGTVNFELRLDHRVGNPLLRLISGPRLAQPYSENYDYGFSAGQLYADTVIENDRGYFFSNPTPGIYNVSITANDSRLWEYDYPDASADLVIAATPPPDLAFDGGTITVNSQPSNTLRYFKVIVPATPGLVGWDLRLKSVPAGSLPLLMVQRDRLPSDSTGGSWVGDLDWTGRNPDLPYYRNRSRLVLGMGSPLQPGTYYVAVSNPTLNNPGAGPLTYTLESRGIGEGQVLATPSLTFAGGTLSVNNLAPREAAYVKVTVPPGTRSWEFTLSPAVGEMMMCVRRGSIPDFNSAVFTPYSYTGEFNDLNNPNRLNEAAIQKTGPERYVLMPSNNQDFVQPGDYYIAVVSEGQNPPDANHTGAGTSSGILTSHGPLATTSLGSLPSTETTLPVSLFSGQMQNFSFTVPEGTANLVIRLRDRIGNPVIALTQGSRLAKPIYTFQSDYYRTDYGFNAGQTTDMRYHADTLSLPNPTPGTYSLNLYASKLSESPYAHSDASTTLSLTASQPAVLAFHDGSQAVVDQPTNSWRFFRVTVPSLPGLLGWEVRAAQATGGTPTVVVRRDLAPDSTERRWSDGNSDLPQTSSTWPSGNHWVGLGSSAGTNPASRLVMGMGGPLEPGTYIVGVFNSSSSETTTYTVESRPIGEGQTTQVSQLAFSAGSSLPINALPNGEIAFLKVTIPTNTPSWELTLSSTVGELMMSVRRGTIPCFYTQNRDDLNEPSYFAEVSLGKAGPERLVVLPTDNQNFLRADDYYIAVLSQGQSPSGPSSGVLTSQGPLARTDLGAVSFAGTTQSVNLLSGQMRNFTFTVPAGTPALEIRLDQRVGNPVMRVMNGLGIARPAYPPRSPPVVWLLGEDDAYGINAGQLTGTDTAFDDSLITLSNPTPGVYNLSLHADSIARDSERPFEVTYDRPDASASLVIRQLPFLPLNFDASLNANGLSHTSTVSLGDGQKSFHRIEIPATFGGQPVLGWVIRHNLALDQGTVRAYPVWGGPGSGGELSDATSVLVPPDLTPGTPWIIEVESFGANICNLSSEAVVLRGPAYAMPLTQGTIFADTGADGVEVAPTDWHFYAVDVPDGNSALLRAELHALSGNPDLYLREDGVPALTPSWRVDRSLSNANTPPDIAHWVPFDGRTEKQLRPGRWNLAVKADGAASARYRLLLSTVAIPDLPLDGASVTNQILAAGDWRHYRFTVPLEAPLAWNVTFSTQSGDARLLIRDLIPSGSAGEGREISADSDSKNLRSVPFPDPASPQGPGAHTYGTPFLRPGSVYYLSVKADTDTAFSLSTTTSSDTIGNLPVLDYTSGTLSASLAPGATAVYRIPVPAEATRLMWTSLHHASVSLLLEQGTLPDPPAPSHWAGTGANSSLNQALSPTQWPWQPAQDYYLRFTNSSAEPQNVSLRLLGQNAATEFADTDADGLRDSWEQFHFGTLASQGGNSDPDNDGLSNLLELALGRNPQAPDPKLLSTFINTYPPNEPPNLGVYVQHGPDLGGVTLKFQTAPTADSANWTDVINGVNGASVYDSDMGIVAYLPLSGEKLFVRLVATLP